MVETMRCDVCNKEMNLEDGYVLTTTEVTTCEAYWLFVLTQPLFKNAIALLGSDRESEAIAMLARHYASQKKGWLICEGCIQLFNVDRKVAKGYTKKAISSGDPANYCPRGTGPANLKAVLPAAAEAWTTLKARAK